MSNVLITQGTEIPVATDTVGTLRYQIVKLDVGAGGASSPFTGTIGEITNLAGGTVTRVNQGSITVTTGTINAGTVRHDGRPARNILTYGTTFSGTAAAYGTLVGSTVVGAGTSTWVENISIVNSGTTVITAMVGFGTALNGTSSLVKGRFGTTGGIEKPFIDAVNAGMTNQDLVCYIDGAGTIDVNIAYFISA